MTSGVYSITCAATKDRYVGQSINIERRWQAHRNAMIRAIRRRYSNLDGSTNLLIQALAVRHGVESFRFGILEACDRLELLNRERFWIEKLCPTLNSSRPRSPA